MNIQFEISFFFQLLAHPASPLRVSRLRSSQPFRFVFEQFFFYFMSTSGTWAPFTVTEWRIPVRLLPLLRLCRMKTLPSAWKVVSAPPSTNSPTSSRSFPFRYTLRLSFSAEDQVKCQRINSFHSHSQRRIKDLC